MNNNRKKLTLISIAIIISFSSGYFIGKNDIQFHLQDNNKYQLGDIARKDIIAPFNFPLMKPEEKLKTDLDKARNRVHPIFNYNQNFEKDIVDTLATFFELLIQIQNSIIKQDSTIKISIINQLYLDFPFTANNKDWNQYLKSPDGVLLHSDLVMFKREIIQKCKDLLAEGIIDIPKSEVNRDSVILNKDGLESITGLDDVNDLKQTQNKWFVKATELYPDKNDPNRMLGSILLLEIIRPNLIYDKVTTEKHQQDSMNRVPRFYGIILKDERIVDKNMRITPDILMKLRSLEKAQSLRSN